MLSEKELKKILDAILSSEWFKDYRLNRNIEDEIEAYGYQLSKTDFELQALDDFFCEDEEIIYGVRPVWDYVRARISMAVDYVLENPQRFHEKGRRIRLGEYADDCVEELHVQLADFYQKLLDNEWAGLTVEEAKEKLPKGQQYAALLDANGKLTREPIPIIRNMQAKIKGEIKLERGKYRLYIESDIPFIGDEDEPCRHRVIDLRKNEVSFAIIKV